MAQLDAAGDFDVEKEREFCVRDVPPHIKDWEIFNIFKRFGLVDAVRFPGNQDRDREQKFCFVSMLNLNGADNVRENLVKGVLHAEGLALRVGDVRGPGMPSSRGPPAKFNNYRGAGGKVDPRARHQQQHASPKKEKIAYSSADLLHNAVCEVRVVTSPFPVNVDAGFTFHALNITVVPDGEYTALQKEMNDYCHDPQNAVGDVEVGETVLFHQNDIAYRALRTKKDTIYLVDMGREEKYLPGNLYRMQQRFAILPTLVIECSLARVKWNVTTAQTFSNLRHIIFKWQDSEGPLKASLQCFKGSVNMVHLVDSKNNNLTESLAKRGDISILPEGPSCTYSREQMNAIRAKVIAQPNIVNLELKNAEGILVSTDKAKELEREIKGLVM